MELSRIVKFAANVGLIHRCPNFFWLCELDVLRDLEISFLVLSCCFECYRHGYETKFNLIDESLVRRRNKVAHGDYLDLGAADFRSLADEILQMMRDYKTDLQNAASMAAYRRPPSVAQQ